MRILNFLNTYRKKSELKYLINVYVIHIAHSILIYMAIQISGVKLL